MPRLLVNIDVPDLDRAISFYTAAFGLEVARRFVGGFAELSGTDALIYLLEKEAGTRAAGQDLRRYDRHWSPIHFDLVVENIATAVSRAIAAGAVREGGTVEAPYGRLAMFADPFGHGFCLIEFNGLGYDALATLV